MGPMEMNDPPASLQVEPYALVRLLYLAVNDGRPNELWFIGSPMELQEELSLEHYTDVRFNLGDEIPFQQSVMKVVAIEITPLPSCPPMPAAQKVMTYYIASSDFPLM